MGQDWPWVMVVEAGLWVYGDSRCYSVYYCVYSKYSNKKFKKSSLIQEISPLILFQF